MPLTWISPWTAGRLLQELSTERDALSLKLNTLLATNEAATLEIRGLLARIDDLDRDVQGRTDLHAAAVAEFEQQAAAFAGERATMERAVSDHEQRCALVIFQNARLREDLDKEVERLTAADRERRRLAFELDQFRNAFQRDADLWLRSLAADDSVLTRVELGLRAGHDLPVSADNPPGRPADHVAA